MSDIHAHVDTYSVGPVKETNPWRDWKRGDGAPADFYAPIDVKFITFDGISSETTNCMVGDFRWDDPNLGVTAWRYAAHSEEWASLLKEAWTNYLSWKNHDQG